MRTYYITLIVIAIIAVFLVGFTFGYSMNKPVIVIKMDNPEMLKLAYEFHGLEKDQCRVTDDGVFYFVRDDKWCSLYSIPFREWYRERRVK